MRGRGWCGVWLIGLVVVLVGVDIYLAVWLLRSWLQARASVQWRTAPGRIVSATRKELRGRPPQYLTRVAYAYTVDGREYQGDAIRFADQGSFNAAEAQDILDRYKPGSEVTVHYDPARPSRAVLEPFLDAKSFLLGVGLTVCSLAFTALIVWVLLQP